LPDALKTQVKQAGESIWQRPTSNALLWLKTTVMYAGALSFMNWTSTQHTAWADQSREFASAQTPFRLEHVFGQKEQEICDNLCAEHNFRQEKHGSFVLFTPKPS
jgi:hypothetical protein